MSRFIKRLRLRGIVAIVATAIWLACSPIARAQNWNGAGINDNWSTNANWIGGVKPINNTINPAFAADVAFAGSTRLTPNTDVAWTIHSLYFNQTAGAFILGGQPLTIGDGGITKDTFNTNAETVNNPVVLASDQNWNVSSIPGDLILGGAISGGGAITIIGGGNVVLNGSAANTFTGPIVVNAGILQLNKPAVANATLSGVQSYPGNTLTIGNGSGSAIVRLLAQDQINDYTSATINPGGVLDINGFSEYLQTITLNGGTIQTGGGFIYLSARPFGQAQDILTLASSTTANITGNVNLNGTGIFNVAAGTTSSGIDLDVSAVCYNGSLVKNGPGTLRLSGANTFSGGLSLNSGTLLIGNNSAAGTGTLALNGGTIQADGSARTLTNPITLSGSPVVAGALRLTLNGGISGTGGLTINNPGGELQLGGSAANTYSGPTIVNSGSLTLQKSTTNATIVGSSLTIGDGVGLAGVSEVASNQIGDSTPVTINAPSLLSVNNNVSEYLVSTTFNGGNIFTGSTFSTFISMGAVTVNPSFINAYVSGRVNQNVSFTWNVVGGSPSPHDGIDMDVPADVFGAGAIIKTGAGTLLLSGSNGAWSGGLTVSAGTVLIGNTTQFGNNDPVGTGTLTLNGGTIQAYGAARVLTVPVNLTAASTVSGAQDLTLTGVVSGSGRLLKTGTGKLTLGNSNNACTGGITVTGGELVIASDTSLGALPAVPVADNLILDGGTLGLSTSPVSLGANRGITLGAGGGTIDTSPSYNVFVHGAISGSGALTKVGNGYLILLGQNTYAGGTFLDAGVIQVGSLSNPTIGSLPGDVVIAGSSDLLFARTDPVTYAGIISGQGLVGVFSGPLTLTGNSTYTGGTYVDTGVSLQLGNGGVSGSIVGDVDNEGALIFNRSNTLTFAGSISGNGSLAKSGSGKLVLTGASSYSGGTTVSAGTLVVGHVNALGTGGLTINNNATTQLQAGLNAPLQLPSLTIAGGAMPTATYGDADLSGSVAGTDYSLIDNAFAMQGVPLAGGSSPAVAAAAQPVPEPAALILAALGFFGIAFRGSCRQFA